MSNKTKKYILISAIILTLTFVVSFLVFDRYLNNKLIKREEQERETLAQENREVLKNDELVVLCKDNKEERVVLLKDLKNELNLSGEISEQKLSDVLKNQGYEVVDISESRITYNREADSSLESNKYYILEKDGSLAIYKTDDKGKASIENEKEDVFVDRKPFKQLPEIDQKKISDHEFIFNNKQDAQEKISELIS
ncbi:MAG: hypothetical protein PUE01_10215 [Clostridiaceae bacterium]|nr:hypothetical protein [Clostridiaceae bacterium]